MANGTDALALSLKSLGVGPGDEVITVPNTFIATAGAIIMVGARPVFVDIGADYNMDPARIADAITDDTKAILPVHLTGNPADMPAIMDVASYFSTDSDRISVVEDAAQAILATIDGQHVGSWGEASGFSLHPLKNLNVWGDGGVIVTRSEWLHSKLRLLRNHGLVSRDEASIFGYNSRLDSIQAAVGLRVMRHVERVTQKRISNAAVLDRELDQLNDFISIPPRRSGVRQVYHTYMIRVARRDALLAHLLANGVDAKVHYPTPLHLQPAASELGYKRGDFPVCEEFCDSVITLPIHQYLTEVQLEYMVEQCRRFYLSSHDG